MQGWKITMLRSAVLVVAGILASVVPAHGTVQAFHQVYLLSPGGTFSLDNVNGSVQVEGWEREEVEVDAVKTAKQSAADADLVKIEVESSGGNVAVHTKYPQGSGVEVAVDFRVHVPYQAVLGEVGTVNGSVSVRGLEGGGQLHSVNGNVEVVDSGGRYSAHTTNGDIHMELHRLPVGRPMEVGTVNGSLVVALPPDASANLAVHSLNGDFRSEMPVKTTAGQSPRVFEGTLGDGGDPVTLSTVNGGIRVVVERPSV
jgi:hypothetical protein